MSFKNIYKLIKPYKKDILCLGLTLSLSALIAFILPLLNKKIMDEGFLRGDYNVLFKVVISILGVNVLDILIKIWGSKKRIDIQTDLEFDLKKQIFDHLINLKMKNITNINSVELSSNIEVDVTNISTIVDENCVIVFSQVFNLIGGFLGLLLISKKLMCIILLFMVIKYFVVIHYSDKIKIFMNEYMIKVQKYSKWFGGVVSGIKEIKLFDMYDYIKKKFIIEVTPVVQGEKRVQMNSQMNNYANQITTYLMNAVLYIWGGYMVVNQDLSVGSMFAFITYGTYVMSPISSILNIKYYISNIAPSYKRYCEFLDLGKEENYYEKDKIKGKYIKFCDICFSYEGDKEILKNVNLEIVENEKVAIIGNNGSGKTTLIELLLRLSEPTSGEIIVDGLPINKYKLCQYRKLFSVVSQDIYLFNDSILNNICLYKNISQNVVNQAIIDSGLQDFVNEKGIDYCVGENGNFLSGGQKQKIALARALLLDRKIFVFDEATSNIDIDFEEEFNRLLDINLKYKIVIMITHKRNSLKYMDKVYEIKDFQIRQLENIF